MIRHEQVVRQEAMRHLSGCPVIQMDYFPLCYVKAESENRPLLRDILIANNSIFLKTVLL